MKIVIKISEEMYERVSNSENTVYVLDEVDLLLLVNAIAHGTPLDDDYKTLLIKLENAEDVIRGLKSDLQDAREELRERW